MKPRLSLFALLLWSSAIPVWLYVVVTVGSSPGNNYILYILTPLVLLGITAALHRLLRKVASGWAIAFLAAPVLAFMVLAAIAWSTRE